MPSKSESASPPHITVVGEPAIRAANPNKKGKHETTQEKSGKKGL